jgi:hypothetical protein
MVAWQGSQRVGNVKNDDASLIAPTPTDGVLVSL